MKYLLEWEEEWEAMFSLHVCDLSSEMLDEWNIEKEHALKFYKNLDSSSTIIGMSTRKLELHVCAHEKWLQQPAINMDEPYNLKILSNLTHPDDRIFSIETELMGYEILMSLSFCDRKNFRIKYQRRFQDKIGEYIYYLLIIKVHKFDKNGDPLLIFVETKRMPKKFQPEKIHYRVFSHNAKGKTKQAELILKKLSNRELQVLELAHEGYKTKEIGLKLGISPNTVKNERNCILKKMIVNNMHLAYEVASNLKMI